MVSAPFFHAPIRAALALLLLGGVFAAPSHAETPVRSAPSEPVELFAALDQQVAAAEVFAKDSTVVNLQLRNLTDRPLTLRMPAALAAVPVLMQQPFGGFNNGAGNNNNSGNQAVGIGGPNNNRNNNNNFNPGGQNPGFFNIPAEKVIKVRLECVCLEHGKREPNLRLKYALKPLAEVCSYPHVETVLAALGRGEVRQSVAQLAAWNLANGKGWDELAAQKIEHVTGLSSPRFPFRDVTAAREWVETLTAQTKSRQTLSSR